MIEVDIISDVTMTNLDPETDVQCEEIQKNHTSEKPAGKYGYVVQQSKQYFENHALDKL